jgi:hypothetical protein
MLLAFSYRIEIIYLFILCIFSCLFYVENAQMNNNTFDNDDDDLWW